MKEKCKENACSRRRNDPIWKEPSRISRKEGGDFRLYFPWLLLVSATVTWGPQLLSLQLSIMSLWITCLSHNSWAFIGERLTRWNFPKVCSFKTLGLVSSLTKERAHTALAFEASVDGGIWDTVGRENAYLPVFSAVKQSIVLAASSLLCAAVCGTESIICRTFSRDHHVRSRR